MLVLEILECGLYHEQKRYIHMSKCGRNVLKTRRYDSALSTLFLNFIKTAPQILAGWVNKMSSAGMRKRNSHARLLTHLSRMESSKCRLR